MEGLGRKLEKNAACEGEREKYGSLEREGERNCSFQGLAGFQTALLGF